MDWLLAFRSRGVIWSPYLSSICRRRCLCHRVARLGLLLLVLPVLLVVAVVADVEAGATSAAAPALVGERSDKFTLAALLLLSAGPKLVGRMKFAFLLLICRGKISIGGGVNAATSALTAPIAVIEIRARCWLGRGRGRGRRRRRSATMFGFVMVEVCAEINGDLTWRCVGEVSVMFDG